MFMWFCKLRGIRSSADRGNVYRKAYDEANWLCWLTHELDLI